MGDDNENENLNCYCYVKFLKITKLYNKDEFNNISEKIILGSLEDRRRWGNSKYFCFESILKISSWNW